jgi:hypothetical protein
VARIDIDAVKIAIVNEHLRVAKDLDMTNFKRVCTALAVAALFSVATTFQAIAQADLKYPIVFDQTKRLEELGIHASFNTGKNFKHTANQCYAYGEGGLSLSVSDALLARYKAKGFTLNSLCMGLVSEARFDPETGRRLPTYLLVDRVALKASLKGRDPKTLSAKQLAECCSEPGTSTEELPLVIPLCFKNGTPYSDCDWQYGIKTGVKVRDSTRAQFRRLGQEIERIMAVVIRDKLVCASGMGPACVAERWSDIPRAVGEDAFGGDALAPETYAMQTIIDGQTRADLKMDPNLVKLSKAMFVDISKTLPKGFGYALHADGAAGPSVTATAIRAALGDGEPEAQVSGARLRELLDE